MPSFLCLTPMMYETLPTFDGTLERAYSSDEENLDVWESLGGTCGIILQCGTNRLTRDRTRSQLLARLSSWNACWGEISAENANQLNQNWYMYFTDKRHETTGNPKSVGYELQDWRMKDRLKTVSAA